MNRWKGEDLIVRPSLEGRKLLDPLQEGEMVLMGGGLRHLEEFSTSLSFSSQGVNEGLAELNVSQAGSETEGRGGSEL